MAVPIQGPIILWEHLTCGCPLHHQRAGKEVCALCFPDPTWPEEVLILLHSIVEGKTVTSGEHEKIEGTYLPAPDETVTKTEGRQQFLGEATEWTEREKAYAYGVHLLEAMTRNGYVVEVRLRPVGSRYQLVLKGADGELVCEKPKQVEYLIEQAQNRTL